jgi:hypothetical protein
MFFEPSERARLPSAPIAETTQPKVKPLDVSRSCLGKLKRGWDRKKGGRAKLAILFSPPSKIHPNMIFQRQDRSSAPPIFHTHD